ncbi:PilC/PilY family type IV pilus protein [Moraxella nonliquefaciens]|uniref:PilY1 beta-propeller domain-containing protein n=1 Tax=Moraxella nonliquefaciens TaxID=478 RepID=A0A1B8QL62_MORNO|nr:PilC/PilY family type IV pilus protein [Moraxella nonliquefaciens]OBX84462.1 hypothetical protein A7456_10645 [Moraxella nonliquefaciens]QPT45079.1 hypothetical protein I6G26_03440 [Moraxella nonliquefaciens]QQC30111.1 hypothetical protein I6H63_02225 [Moraxella nonliquefaciens]
MKLNKKLNKKLTNQPNPPQPSTSMPKIAPKLALSHLFVAMGALLASNSVQADTAVKKIGDLEIYQAAQAGKINLTMMLDTSGSMGISSLVLPKNNLFGSPGDVDKSLCKQAIQDGVPQWQYNAVDRRPNSETRGKTSFKKTVTVGGEQIDYYLRGCTSPDSKTKTPYLYPYPYPYIDHSGNLVEDETGKFDRLSRLKDALINLIASDTINSNVRIGLGTFSAKTNTKLGDSDIPLVDGHSGVMLVPAAPLDTKQKIKLIKAIAAIQSIDAGTDQTGKTNANYQPSNQNPIIPDDLIKSSSGTPTAHAYAEVGAYMMGTSTGTSPNLPPAKLKFLYDGETIMKKGNDTIYWLCVNLRTPNRTTAMALRNTAGVFQCDNQYFNDNYLYLQNNKYYLRVESNSYPTLGNNPNTYQHLYKPDGTKATQQEANKALGGITQGIYGDNRDYVWHMYKRIPNGWRLGGWMKVPYQSMDIEPVTSKNWTNAEAGAASAVSYRTNPFAIEYDVKQTSSTTTERKLVYDKCPTGFQPDGYWPSLCYKERSYADQWKSDAIFQNEYNLYGRRVTRVYCDQRVSPAVGKTDTLTYHFDENNRQFPKNPVDKRYDKANVNVNNWENPGTGKCYQKRHYITRKVYYKNVTNTDTQETQTPIDNMYGGFIYSADETKNGNHYHRGATPPDSPSALCDANGIYFLTDGAPNSTKDDMAKTILNRSLNNEARYTITSKPSGLPSPRLQSGLFAGETGGWEWIGEYAKRLNDPTKNPAGVSIKTAVAGFGSSFAGLNYNSVTKKYDCNTEGASDDAKNACKWGQRGEGYGEGGFFHTQSSQDIADSIVDFILSLDNTIPASPSGVITVPKDPFKAIGEMPYAFMPTVEPRVGGGANSNVWLGNVKKYNLHNGTLQGKNNKSIFKGISGSLDSSVADFWSNASGRNDNDLVKVGGVYSNLAHPNTALNNVRTVYVEDITAKDASTTEFKKLGVDVQGRPVGFDQLYDTTTYNKQNQIRLLQFLGFSEATYNNQTKSLDEWASSSTDIKDLTLVKPSSTDKVLGASIHSKPIAVSYGASLDDKGRVLDTDRQDYVFFGSMDGALHLVNAKDRANGGGTEDVAIIPRIMMKTQPEALVPNSTYSATADRATGVPKFGIDGHWTFKNTYKYDYKDKQVKPADRMLAYGGMRLGGEGLLALDITNKNEPKKAFSSQNSALINSQTPGFERIGYIWNQPTLARIKTSKSDTKGTDVIIFGGGYDMCYEYEGFQHGRVDGSLGSCSNKTDIKGNAVYIVDANTGKLLWRASSNSNGSITNAKTHEDLKHSIVAGISAIDRNADGITDHLYFGDLGGQLFRVDFKDGMINDSQITKLLKNEYENTANAKYTHRFYEMPVVSIHRNPTSNQLFALINIVSGDRSSPLSKMRNDNQYADRVYGIIDTDVTKINLFDDKFTKTVKDLTNNKLVDLSTAMGPVPSTGYTDDQRISAMQPMIKGVKQGWYYPLTRFDGWSDVRYGKGVGKADIFANHLYISVFNPDMSYSNANACTAKIAGGTERQMYCLPYGVCVDPAGTPASQKRYTQSKNGTAGFIRAGQGLQELNFGPISSDRTDARVLINTTSITEQIKQQNRVNFGTDAGKRLRPPSVGLGNQSGSSSPNNPPIIGLNQTNITTSGGSTASSVAGDGTGELSIESQRYMLQPRQWYEKP